MEVEITMDMKTKHLIPIILMSFVVGAAISLAQPVPPTPATQPVPPTEQIAGTVSMYLLNPRGEVDGLLLADGSQVKFPPHMSADLTRSVKPNERITAQGVREVSPVFTAFTITNSSGQSLNEARPMQPPPPPDLQGVNLKPMQADEKIRVVLDDGMIVRIAPHVSTQFSALLQTGATISAKGYGTENEFGRAFEATEVGAQGQTLTPIYGAALMPPRP